MEETEANIAIQKIELWFEENSNWLTEWLTNVILLPQGSKDMSGKVFQTFVAPVQGNGIGHLLQASAGIKFALLRQSVFGKEHKQTIITNTPKPTLFRGFIDKIGRAPEEGDIALYTAYNWFTIINHQVQGVFLTTTCTVDFIPKR